MTGASIHITDADATTDFGSVLAHVRAGTEVVIESNQTEEFASMDRAFSLFQAEGSEI